MIDRAQSTPETPVIDPVTQAKAQLAGLDDEGLQAIRQAAQEISEERDGDVSDLVAGYEDFGTEYDSLYGWQAPTTTYEEDFPAPESREIETDDSDPFSYLGGAA